MLFCLPARPFLRSFFSQITTGTTRTDTARPDTMTEGTATAVIETGTGIVMTDATGTEDTTGIVTGGTTTGDLEDTMEDGDIGGNARRDLVQDAKTTCRLMPLQRAIVVTAETVTEGGARNVEGMEWALRNEGVLPRRMRLRFP